MLNNNSNIETIRTTFNNKKHYLNFGELVSFPYLFCIVTQYSIQTNFNLFKILKVYLIHIQMGKAKPNTLHSQSSDIMSVFSRHLTRISLKLPIALTSLSVLENELNNVDHVQTNYFQTPHMAILQQAKSYILQTNQIRNQQTKRSLHTEQSRRVIKLIRLLELARYSWENDQITPNDLHIPEFIHFQGKRNFVGMEMKCFFVLFLSYLCLQ